jgi:UDP-N-acetylmuramate dehydrogenase
MTCAALTQPHWSERLPPVRGRLTRDAPLSGLTWFRVGGAAELLFRPADVEDLASVLAALPPDVPVTVIGIGSNLLVRDGGIAGLVIRLTGPFAGVTVEGESVVAGTAALDLTVAMTAAEAGIAGLEFLSGIPGTIGGALRMNAGAYGGDMRAITREATALDRSGRIQVLSAADLGFGYRSSAAPADWIFLSAGLRGVPGDAEDIARRMAEIRRMREDSQPTRTRTGGSTFANPDPKLSGGLRAWELIDRAGCRGLTVGGAMVSEKHCNFLINTGTATAADIEDLGEEVRRRVREETGIDLQWEIRRLGQRGPAATSTDGDTP